MARRQKGSTRSNRSVKVRMLRLAHAVSLDLPDYQTEGSAGLDLVAAVPAGQPLRLKPMQRELVPTGLVLELPSGLEAQVRPRSGLALRHGITVLNSPGTIDNDYRGELKVLLINLGEKAWSIERGERIAQLVVARVERIELVAVGSVQRTSRGTGGFGSTGPGAKAPLATGGKPGRARAAAKAKARVRSLSKPIDGARRSPKATDKGGARTAETPRKPGTKAARKSGRRLLLNGHGAASIKKGKTYPRRRQVGQRTPRARR